MQSQSLAHIYLGKTRKNKVSEGVRSLYIFDTKEYETNETSVGISNISVLETFLPPSGKIEIKADSPFTVIIIPMAGGLELFTNESESSFIELGESKKLILGSEDCLTVANPYELDTIQFIHLKFPSISTDGQIDETFPISLSNANQLTPLFTISADQVRGYMGQYEGRAEDSFVPYFKHMLAYIILGAFEVQNRLLETGDALLLQNASEVEFEALSNGALILLLDLPSLQ